MDAGGLQHLQSPNDNATRPAHGGVHATGKEPAQAKVEPPPPPAADASLWAELTKFLAGVVRGRLPAGEVDGVVQDALLGVVTCCPQTPSGGLTYPDRRPLFALGKMIVERRAADRLDDLARRELLESQRVDADVADAGTCTSCGNPPPVLVSMPLPSAGTAALLARQKAVLPGSGSRLGPTERGILRQLAAGVTSRRQIAAHLGVSTEAVRKAESRLRKQLERVLSAPAPVRVNRL